MILPKKHISITASLIGLGGIVLEIISENSLTLDEIWEILNEKYIDNKVIKKKHNFDNFILTIDLLYLMKAIDINTNGELYQLKINCVNLREGNLLCIY